MIQDVLCSLDVHRWHRKLNEQNGLDVTRCLYCGAVKETKPVIVVAMPSGQNQPDTLTLRFNHEGERDKR